MYPEYYYMYGKQYRPDQMPQNVASDLGLHCLQRLLCPNTLGYYSILKAKDLLPFSDGAWHVGKQIENRQCCLIPVKRE